MGVDFDYPNEQNHQQATGLSSVPGFPEARLLERTPADLTAGGMPEEKYSSDLSPSEIAKDPRLAAADFIARSYSWQIMLTVTNSPYGGEPVTATGPGASEPRPHFVSEVAADKRFIHGMKRANRKVFGQRYYRKPTMGFTWAGTMEFQKSGNPHHHALLYTAHWESIEKLLEKRRIGKRVVYPQIEAAFREAGAGPIIRAELCATRHEAAAYITKACRYVTKTDGLSYGGPWRNHDGSR